MYQLTLGLIVWLIIASLIPTPVKVERQIQVVTLEFNRDE